MIQYAGLSEINGPLVCLEGAKGVSYDEISIGRVAVKKNYRGNGISREMMSKAIEFRGWYSSYRYVV